jgi:hypothetical protein
MSEQTRRMKRLGIGMASLALAAGITGFGGGIAHAATDTQSATATTATIPAATTVFTGSQAALMPAATAVPAGDLLFNVGYGNCAEATIPVGSGGTDVNMRICDEAVVQQEWTAGTVTGCSLTGGPCVTILSVLNGYCLTANAVNAAVGTDPCDGTQSQKWTELGNYLAADGTGQCLTEVAGGSIPTVSDCPGGSPADGDFEWFLAGAAI